MPADGHGRKDAIVFAYDGSGQAKAAIRAAARQLGPDRDAIVVTVWEPLASHPLGEPGTAGPEIEADIAANARKLADEGTRLARSVGFRASSHVVSGSPVWHALIDFAGDHAAGMLVLGSHGRTGIRRVLLGSVSSGVVTHADRPVLVVHPPGQKQAA
jgi:nucleotide-binding universal stress UspA family protein